MLAMILAFCGGLMIVTSKSLNNAAAKSLGLLPGSLINFITGSIVAFSLALVFSNKLSGLMNMGNVPWYFFLAGVFGLTAMLVSNFTLHRLPVLHSTTLIVAAQMLTALVIDFILFGVFSLIKSLAALIVVVALIWDQKIIKETTSII